jgi:hypothetical protein
MSRRRRIFWSTCTIVTKEFPAFALFIYPDDGGSNFISKKVKLSRYRPEQAHGVKVG